MMQALSPASWSDGKVITRMASSNAGEKQYLWGGRRRLRCFLCTHSSPFCTSLVILSLRTSNYVAAGLPGKASLKQQKDALGKVHLLWDMYRVTSPCLSCWLVKAFWKHKCQKLFCQIHQAWIHSEWRIACINYLPCAKGCAASASSGMEQCSK